MTATDNPIDPRRIEYLPLDRLKADPRNPKAHDLDVLDASVGRFGYLEPIILDGRTDQIISGHGRAKTLTGMQLRGETAPEGVNLGPSGEWLVPVVVGWASRTDTEAAAALIALNRTSEVGGWVDDSLLELLDELRDVEGGMDGIGYGEDDVENLRSRLMELNSPSFSDQIGHTPGAHIPKSPITRKGHLDLIFSTTNIRVMPLARNLGWGWGLISARAGNQQRLMPQLGYHPIFMDNEWHGYDHKQHVESIAHFHPKYATTRDLLTKEQAAEAGVEWYSLDQTLEMAAEVAEHCDNVIIIPKYECLDRIPREINGTRVVLGFSVPSSYGGTKVPLEQFRGWPVHLLGGSWKSQRGALDVLGDDVVSLDNNHLQVLSQYGTVQLGDGKLMHLNEAIPAMDDFITGRWLMAIMFSLAAIQTAVINDYAPQAQQEAFHHEVEDFESQVYTDMLTDTRVIEEPDDLPDLPNDFHDTDI